MKFNPFEDFDLKTTYQKLIAPSRPRMVKACDFFTKPDLITPLQKKLANAVKQKARSDR